MRGAEADRGSDLIAHRRAAFAAGLATVAVAAAFSACGGDDPTETGGERFGVNGQALRQLAATGDLASVDRQLAAIADGGLTFVRAPIDWRVLEPTPERPPAFDFTQLDAWVGALAEHELRWQAVLLGTPGPSWALNPGAVKAGCGSSAHPDTADPFAGMAGAVAARYGEGGDFWTDNPDLEPRPVTDFEIWNEPNIAAFWCPHPDPGRYADLAVAASEQVRKADPAAEIMLGGLASQPVDQTAADGASPSRQTAETFLDAAIGARPELADAIDVAALHSYGPTPADVLADVAAFRADLNGLGLEDVGISLDEVGWPTQGTGGFPPVAEKTRADYLGEVTRDVMSSGCDVVSIAPHTWTTAEADPTNFEDWFGIADPASGEPYPSGSAYLDAAEDERQAGEPADDAPCGSG